MLVRYIILCLQGTVSFTFIVLAFQVSFEEAVSYTHLFFSLSHMHYVGRSFRLLNPSYVRPCTFGAFFWQKISPCGNFLPETEGKTRSPAGTDEL